MFKRAHKYIDGDFESSDEDGEDPRFRRRMENIDRGYQSFSSFLTNLGLKEPLSATRIWGPTRRLCGNMKSQFHINVHSVQTKN